MNDNDISSLYPPPPPYYKYFTSENIARYEEWKASSVRDQPELEPEKDDSDEKEKDPNTNEPPVLPPGELKLLVPPPVPSGTHYRGYGNLWLFEEKLPLLKDSGWTQLYADDDDTISSKKKIEELHKLMDLLLVNFLELVGVMSVDPREFHVKIEHLKLVLININHLLNSYRPHQTRETLIMLLRKQIESKRKDIVEIEDTSKTIKDKIALLVDSISVSSSSSSSSSALNNSTSAGVSGGKNDTIDEIEDRLVSGL